MKVLAGVVALFLIMGCSVLAATSISDLEPEAVATRTITSEAMLVNCLESVQRQYLPVSLPSISVRLLQPAGSFPADFNGFDPAIRKSLLGRIDENEIVSYTVGLYEDFWTSDVVVVVDDLGREIYRIQREKSYDPYDYQRILFGLNETEVLSDSFSRGVFLPHKISTVVEMIPVVFWKAHLKAEEARAAQRAAMAPMSMMMSSSPEEVTNLWVGIGSTTNGNIELSLRWPTNYTDRICLFATTNMTSEWHLFHTNVVTVGRTNYTLLNPEIPMPGQNFFRSGNADLNSDGDSLVDSHEVVLYGTDPNDTDTDDDQLNDDWEVSHGIDPLNGLNALNVQNFPDLDVDEPTTNYPVGFSSFNPPVSNGNYATPMVAEWTRSADQYETVVMTSIEEIEALAIYSTSTNAVAANWFTNGYGHAQMPADGMKIIWPITATETGSPVRVNNTEAWWFGPDLVSTGETFSIFGRNLGTNCFAYIEGHGWLTNTTSHDNKADFIVPVVLTNGTYSVYAHNGLGGKYGWSDAIELEIADILDWSANTQEVASATQSALSDAFDDAKQSAGNDTILIPAGTISISSDMQIPDGVWLKGAGIGQTIIQPATNYPTSGGFALFENARSLNNGAIQRDLKNSKISDLTFYIGYGFNGVNADIIRVCGQRLYIEDCEFSYENEALTNQTQNLGRNLISLESTEYHQTGVHHVYISNCTFKQGRPLLFTGEQVFYEGNTNLGMFDMRIENGVEVTNRASLSALIKVAGLQESAIEHSFATHYSTNDYESNYGWSQGRYFVVQNAVANKIYVGGLQTTNMVPRYNYARGPWKEQSQVHQNAGEQILYENSAPEYRGLVENASLWSLSSTIFTNDWNGSMVSIVAGKGLGQTRHISSVDTVTQTATVAEPWSVIPTNTSIFIVGRMGRHWAVCNNYLDGTPRTYDPTHPRAFATASCAVSFYGGISDSVVVNNVSSETQDGFIQWGFSDKNEQSGHERDPWNQPAYFNLWKDNVVTNGQVGVQIGAYGYDSDATDVVVLGNVFRNNRVYGVDTAMAVNDIEPQMTLEMNVFEFTSGMASNELANWQGINTFTNSNNIMLY